MNPECREYTWYTGVSFSSFLVLLAAGPLLHVAAVLALYRGILSLPVQAEFPLCSA